MNVGFMNIPFNKPFIAGKELYYIAQAVTYGNIAPLAAIPVCFAAGFCYDFQLLWVTQFSCFVAEFA